MESAALSLIYQVVPTAHRLEESLATVEWAVSVIPKRWHHEMPEQAPAGAWGVAMNLAHLAVYEERFAAPALEALARGEDGREAVGDSAMAEFPAEEQELAAQSVDEIMQRLRMARWQQIQVVRTFSADAFNRPLTPMWGQPLHSAGWVATKTFQHTWEHGNAILQVLLRAPA